MRNVMEGGDYTVPALLVPALHCLADPEQREGADCKMARLWKT